MKKKNALIMVVAMILVSALSVAGTLAWLQDATKVVTNTFSVGDVKFAQNLNGGLDEADVDQFGDYDGANKNVYDRVIENEYKLVPGATYTKDPTIHLAEDNEPAFVFVKVANPIEEIEAEGDTTIKKQMEANGWVLFDEENNVWVYNKIVHTLQGVNANAIPANMKNYVGAISKSFDTVEDGAYDMPVFGTFTLKNDAVLKNEDGSDKYTTPITVKAFIIQANGFFNEEAVEDSVYSTEDLLADANLAWGEAKFDTAMTNPEDEDAGEENA